MHAQPTPVHQKFVPPMAKYKGIKANLKQVPKAKTRSPNRWYRDKEKRKVLYVLCGCLACVLIISAIFALPIVLTTLLSRTTTTTTNAPSAPTSVAVASANMSSTTNTGTAAMTGQTTT